MADIPDSHPRKASLLARQSMTEAAARGLLADSAMIAHGRGEAFDYLLGERTIDSAASAISEAASRLRNAKRPVISVNGNTVILAGEDSDTGRGRPGSLGCYYRVPYRGQSIL